MTGAMNAAAAQLLDGTYTPKLNEDMVRKQMQALDFATFRQYSKEADFSRKAPQKLRRLVQLRTT